MNEKKKNNEKEVNNITNIDVIKKDNSNQNDQDDEIDELLDNFLIDNEEDDINDNLLENKKDNNIHTHLYKEEINTDYNNIIFIIKLLIILNFGFNNILLITTIYYSYKQFSSKALISSSTVLYYYIFGFIPTSCMIIVFCIYSLALNWDFFQTFYDFTDLKIINYINIFKDNLIKSFNIIYNSSSIKRIKNFMFKNKDKFQNVIIKYKINNFLKHVNNILGHIFKLLKYIFAIIKEEIFLLGLYLFNRFEKKIRIKRKKYFNNKLNSLKIPTINDKNLDDNMKRDLNNLLNMMNQTKDMMKLVSNKNL
jgi:hypothetical protein